ncbi:MAG TPA: universal stress protein [Symbiobacteriaceae bacterium]|nr:universal stress protein [Symbiobacteriaceae bacterium]
MVAKPHQIRRPVGAKEAGITHALLAVDGSPASVRAAERLRLLLRGFPDARLTVIYVAHLPRDLQVNGAGEKLVVEFPLAGLVRATAAPALSSALDALGSLAVRAETEVQVGEPASEICEYAHSEGVDLIVMGIRGTGPAEVAVGGVANKVLSMAGCPVLLVQ